MYYYHLITNPGLEDIVTADLQRHLPLPSAFTSVEAPAGRPGVTIAASTTPIPAEVFTSLRSVYYVLEGRMSGVIPDLTALEEADACRLILDLASDAPFPELNHRRSIAVRCSRRGNHHFRSPAVERTLGASLVNRYRCPVNLTTPDLTVRVEIVNNTVDVGLLVAGPELDRRYRWLYRPRVTLSTVASYGLLRLSGWEPGRGALLDPFCGSGTIPLEAASLSASASRSAPASRIFASDKDPVAVAGTRANLAINNLLHTTQVRPLNAADPRRFEAAWGNRGITTIVCNPPFGVRLGRNMNFDLFYRTVLQGAAAILPRGGRLVLLSSRRRGALNRVVEATPDWEIQHVRIMQIGGVYPGIFILERR